MSTQEKDDGISGPGVTSLKLKTLFLPVTKADKFKLLDDLYRYKILSKFRPLLTVLF